MFLCTFKFSEYEGTDREWILEKFKLNKINLMVGMNASGKTRTLNSIFALKKVFVETKIPFGNGEFSVELLNNNEENLLYYFKISDFKIEKESLKINKILQLDRDSDGTGKILNLKNEYIEFKIPTNELMAKRRDDYQYPFFSELFDWTSNLKYISFAKDEDKNKYLVNNMTNISHGNQTAKVFYSGKEKYSNFIDLIINDLREIGYYIKNIEFGKQQSLSFRNLPNTDLYGFIIHEKDRKGVTDQNAISNGMYRAIITLIHFNYYMLEGYKGTALIDDIGEGLDYSRSNKLIKILIEKAENIGLQLLMTSNNKFVMNNTNLDYWQVVSRKGSKVSLFNRYTSEEKFEQFRFTGLNNFDFFVTEFYEKGFEKQ